MQPNGNGATAEHSQPQLDDLVFVVVAFEGPDRYSHAGGLGTRVSGLAEALAASGYETHLLFIGDPSAPGEERRLDGKLYLHRWCTWLSREFPAGVYDGEEKKHEDLTRSAPPFIVERIALPAARAGKRMVIISEEWQTAQAAIELSDLLYDAGIRDRAELLWNANHTYGLERIDWPRLTFTNRITTVSRYMRGELLRLGVEADVVPNGIPRRLLRPIRPRDVTQTRAAAGRRMLFFKMARWAPDKGWQASLEALALLRRQGHDVALIARGGGDRRQGTAVLDVARALGLGVVRVGPEEAGNARDATLAAARGADVVCLHCYVDEDFARRLYAASDGVLANSTFEPFGLVGLETMAAGGVAYTGGTGEDYTIPGHNAIVLETSTPEEIVEQAVRLQREPATSTALRQHGKETAAQFTWEASARRLARMARSSRPPAAVH